MPACRAPRWHPPLSSALPQPHHPRADRRNTQKARDQTGAAVILRQGQKEAGTKGKQMPPIRHGKDQFKPGNRLYNRVPLDPNDSRRAMSDQGSPPNPTPGHRPICAISTATNGKTANTARFRRSCAQMPKRRSHPIANPSIGAGARAACSPPQRKSVATMTQPPMLLKPTDPRDRQARACRRATINALNQEAP